MTMDDGNSVYVGGLPYDITEEAVRRAFSVYGSVLTVKTVNDRSVRGKCYGFVTFSNRRSADDAIADMDGKVTTRGGRMNPGRVRFQPRSGLDKSPDRKDSSYDRDWYSDRSRERDRSRSQDRRKDHHFTEKERFYEHSRDIERRNDHDMLDRNGYKERVSEGDEGDRSYRDNGRGINGASAHERRSRIQNTKREDSTMLDSGRGRDHFSSSSGDHSFQVKEELEAMIKMREMLQDEVLVMEERLKEKEVVCSELQKKSKRLEDSLMNENKLTSQHRKELAKLHKSFSRVRECTDSLKDCEHELQLLVSSAAREGVAGADGPVNGYAYLIR